MNTVICPGCGWSGSLEELVNGTCPSCEYENYSDEPYRLLTLVEILALPTQGCGLWNDVDLGPFVRAVVKELETDASKL